LLFFRALVACRVARIEMTFKTLAAAFKAWETPGLEKSDVLRQRGIIIGCKLYKYLFENYVNCRDPENEFLDGRAKIAEHRKKPGAQHIQIKSLPSLSDIGQIWLVLKRIVSINDLKSDFKIFFEPRFTHYKYQLELTDLLEKN
jgi:hypothetical protein